MPFRSEKQRKFLCKNKPKICKKWAKKYGMKPVKKKEGGMIKQAQADYDGSYIYGDLGGVKVSNPSYKKYYKGML
jgi:hypothetical protein